MKWSFQIPKKIVMEEDKQTEGPTANKHLACIPYISGLSEQLQRVFKSHGIPSYQKPFNTLRFLWVSPKHKSKKEKQCVVVYSVKCSECETARMLGTRFQKHPNSGIAEHTSSTGHRYILHDTKVRVKEHKWFPRKIREALHIHKRSPALN